MWGLEKSFLRKECQLASAGPRKRRSTSNSNERGGTLARDKEADQLGEHSTWKCVQEKGLEKLVSLARLFSGKRNNFWIDPKNLVNNTPKRVKMDAGGWALIDSLCIPPPPTHNKQTDRAAAAVHSERINSKVDTLTSVLPLCGMALFTHL